jgi:hypothetical protein
MIQSLAVLSVAYIGLTIAATPGPAPGGQEAKGKDSKGETAEQQAGKPIPPLPELIKKLESQLSGATLVGVFTVDGAKNDRPPKPDQYTLGKVSKLPEGDLWRFEAKVAFGGSNATIPIVVAIKWAGDTPMVQLTNTTIPGLGTFGTRVFFYEDRYAGTWQHGPFGGHMYGRIEKGGHPGNQGDKSGDK